MAKPPESPNATTEAYFRIGQVASAWSTLERIVDETIWALAKIDPQVGACVTAQVQSLRYKMFALISLCDLYKQGDLVKSLNKFLSDAEPVMKARNGIVHTPVMNNEATGAVYRHVMTAERKLVLQSEAPDPQREIAVALQIVALIDRLLPISNEIRARAGS